MGFKLKTRTMFPALVTVQSPLLLSKIGISYSLQILIGAWFFRDRALTRDAHALGWTGGLRFALLAVTMFSVTILAIGLGYREVLRRIAS